MIKFIIFSFLVFFTVYLEPIEILGLKFSILWKLVFLGSLVLLASRYLYVSKLNLTAYLYSFKNLISLGSLSSSTGHFFVFLETLAIPLMLHAFESAYSKNKRAVEKVVIYFTKWLPVTLIIINVPFIFGLLPELAEKKLFGRLGVDVFGFVGPYQNSHSTSIITAGAGIFCLYHYFREDSALLRKMFLALVVASFYIVMTTMVRTGLLVLLVGAAAMYYSKYGFRNIFKLIFIGSFVAAILGIVIYNNELLYMRFFDQSIYEDPGDVHLGTFGSGRLVFAYLNIEYWISQGFFSWIFGVGIDASKDNLEYLLGMRVFSHNGFIDALTHNGALGFILYVLFFLYFYRSVRNMHTNDEDSRYLCYSILFSYIAFALVQGGNRFYFDVLLCLAYFNLRVAR